MPASAVERSRLRRHPASVIARGQKPPAAGWRVRRGAEISPGKSSGLVGEPHGAARDKQGFDCPSIAGTRAPPPRPAAKPAIGELSTVPLLSTTASPLQDSTKRSRPGRAGKRHPCSKPDQTPSAPGNSPSRGPASTTGYRRNLPRAANELRDRGRAVIAPQQGPPLARRRPGIAKTARAERCPRSA